MRAGSESAPLEVGSGHKASEEQPPGSWSGQMVAQVVGADPGGGGVRGGLEGRALSSPRLRGKADCFVTHWHDYQKQKLSQMELWSFICDRQ